MAIIYTNKGEEILVDAEDFERLNSYTWHLDNKGYPRTCVYNLPENPRVSFRMHRLIFGRPDKSIHIGHKNGNRCDNQRHNLRKCGNAQNARNRKSFSPTTGLKGVSYDKVRRRFRAHLGIGGKRLNLGNFHDPIEAGKAYDRAAIEKFGEFALTNATMGLLVQPNPAATPAAF